MSHTVKPLPDGKFDIQDSSGQSVSERFGGAFTQREAAEAACRMLDAFDAVDRRVQTINQQLRSVEPECICHKFIRLHDGDCPVHGHVRKQETVEVERNRKLMECFKALQQVKGDLGFMSLDEDVRKTVEAALIPIGGWEAGLARIHKALFEGE